MAQGDDGGDAFLAAVEAIYGAAVEFSNWPQALQAVAEVFGDVGANLLWVRDDGGFGTVLSPGLAPMAQDYEKWQHLDIRARCAAENSMLAQLDVVTDRHLVSPREIEEHPFYTQFLASNGLRWLASAKLSPDPQILVWVSIQRARTKDPFADAELETLARLARHVEQALRLSVKLFDAELSKLGLVDALARVGVGVFALDSVGRIVFTNPAASLLLGDGLVLANGRLSASAAEDRRALDSAIRRMVRGAPEDVGSAPKPLMIGRERSARPLAVYLLPIAENGAELRNLAPFLMRTRAIALVIDPHSGAMADPALLRDMLGLTLGEARLAALIGTGLPPKGAAEKLGIAESTARAVLKSVFAKTGVSRQSELTALLARLVLR
ncbi:helix-turn-helix transcriptional regulator [Methylosinus sp. Ce-a6]|uniref:helix-turn-helix transcriptional regulator n=1 Tax=Methylosinus sp. Ce-a6 TaxID=2172005 RepID=UPI00135B9E04|nr:helix-turn-helix transcriptional regulator [Methylosinus sp. Ce-a6]